SEGLENLTRLLPNLGEEAPYLTGLTGEHFPEGFELRPHVVHEERRDRRCGFLDPFPRTSDDVAERLAILPCVFEPRCESSNSRHDQTHRVRESSNSAPDSDSRLECNHDRDQTTEHHPEWLHDFRIVLQPLPQAREQCTDRFQRNDKRSESRTGPRGECGEERLHAVEKLFRPLTDGSQGGHDTCVLHRTLHSGETFRECLHSARDGVVHPMYGRREPVKKWHHLV